MKLKTGSSSSLNLSFDKTWVEESSVFLSPKMPGQWGRIRTVSGTELVDEDGYSYVSFPAEIPEQKPTENDWSRRNCVEDNEIIEGPFGSRRCIRLDQSEIGETVPVVETFMSQVVKKTRDEMEILQSESVEIIKSTCGCDEKDAIHPCQSWSTAVFQFLTVKKSSKSSAPILLVSEHESEDTIKTWDPVVKEVVRIPYAANGQLNLRMLEQTVQKIQGKSKRFGKQRLVIGAFSVSHSVTGTIQDDVAITNLLHKYGALSVWDYSDAASHVGVQMNPKTGNDSCDKMARKDGLFFVGHKFVGGPQASGLLVMKSSSKDSKLPVNFSSAYGLIRLGLILQLRNRAGLRSVAVSESGFVQQALNAWKDVPQIEIVDASGKCRLPRISFLVRNNESGLLLHHAFISVLLKDLFGIICDRRRLEDCSDFGTLVKKISNRNFIKRYREKAGLDVPQIIRLTFPYTAHPNSVTGVIEAVKLVATKGWKLLPLYTYEAKRGSFSFQKKDQGIQSKDSLTIASFMSAYDDLRNLAVETERSSRDFQKCLSFASNLIESLEKKLRNTPISAKPSKDSSWFLGPADAQLLLQCPDKAPELFKKSNPMPSLKLRDSSTQPSYLPGSCGRHYLDLISKASLGSERGLREIRRSTSLLSLDVKEVDWKIEESSQPRFSRKKLMTDLNNDYFRK